MTNLDDFDRSLAEFLADGPAAAPEAPVIAALAHARTTPRRPDVLRAFRADPMASRRTGIVVRPAIVLAAVALLIALIGVAVLGSRPILPAIVEPGPSASPAAQPSALLPSPEPSAATFSGSVLLNVTAGSPFLLTVTDMTNQLVAVTSGQPGDGASVDNGAVLVADSTDPNVLTITWSGGPCETGAAMTVDENGHAISIARQACEGDAIALDRIANLRFAGPVFAADWIATTADGPSISPPSSGPDGSPTAQQPLGSPAVPPIHVALRHDSGNAISIDVVDESGLLVRAVSGAVPASEPAREFEITNDSPTVLRLVWDGSPCDTVHRLTIDPSATEFTIDRPFCYGDAMLAVRSLVLTFSRPVDATALTTALISGRGGVDMPSWTTTAPDSAGKRYDLTLADPGYVVDSLSGYFDPSSAAAGAGPSRIRLIAADVNTFTMIWFGRACATTPSLEISPDGSDWRLVEAPCSTTSPDVLRMVDVTLNLPRTTATIPSTEIMTTFAP
jgi:hypothetical protein